MTTDYCQKKNVHHFFHSFDTSTTLYGWQGRTGGKGEGANGNSPLLVLLSLFSANLYPLSLAPLVTSPPSTHHPSTSQSPLMFAYDHFTLSPGSQINRRPKLCAVSFVTSLARSDSGFVLVMRITSPGACKLNLSFSVP